MPMPPTRVLIADDSDLARTRLSAAVSRVPGVEIVGCVARLAETREAVRTLRPGLVILDISFPDGSGLDLLKEIKASAPSTVVAILTNHSGDPFRKAALASGADYFLDKSKDFERVVEIAGDLETAPTDREWSEIPSAASEAHYEILFDSNPHPMWVYDIETLRFLAVNDTATVLYGYSREEFLSMTIVDIRPPGERDRLLSTVYSVRSRVRRVGVWPHRRKDGSILQAEITTHDLLFAGRRARLVLSMDVTERQRAEEELREAERRYRGLFENAVEGIFQTTPEGRFLTVNPSFARMLGYASPEAVLSAVQDVGGQLWIHPERRREYQRLLKEQGVVRRFEAELRRRDGSILWVSENSRAVYDPTGAVERYEGTVEDITERKRIESDLERIEAQLRQSQKMEAIGSLAGGVAHDFNNLLTSILGYTKVALDRLPDAHPVRGDLSEIRKAGERAASLTRQLLAFSRRQILEMRVVDLVTIVDGMENMLRRLIGEDIEFLLAKPAGPLFVKVDRGQIEQVLLNLAVNARDAMPEGGQLTIEMKHVELDGSYVLAHPHVKPGPFVVLAVSDTGTGMDTDTQSRIFEPFFTTKEPGKGTGLGLSTVYGIVKQSEGSIEVYSEPGRGTTFKVYLPHLEAEPDEEAERSEPVSARGTETVLLVEDEEAVLKLARLALESHGYAVLPAANASEAILAAERHEGPIHVLVTDVVLPGRSGPELVQGLLASRPGLRVLFMSGYTDDAIVRHGVLEPGVAFLQKPFSLGALARKVRKILDAPPPLPRSTASV
jgi:PAS domain S-box-containing protein